MTTWTDQLENTGGNPTEYYLLQEDGFYLLLEDGGKIILNTGDIEVIWTDQAKN